MNTFRILPIFIIAFLLGSCSSVSDSSDEDGGDQPWERQFQYGNLRINGTDVLTHESNTMQDHIMDTVCYSDLPRGALQTFSINLYVPTHANDDYQSGGQASAMIVFYDGSQTPKINNEFIFVRRTMLGGEEYSKFLIGGQYNGNDMARDNFQQFRYEFDMIYRNDNEEEIHRDPKAVTVNIEDCGSF